MYLRGIRGATTVDSDSIAHVLQATIELLKTMQAKNRFTAGDIAAVLFTATPDIKSVFPAEAARILGWQNIPLMCFQEMAVADALPLCIRVMVLFNTEKDNAEMQPVYLRGAVVLRRDLI